MKNVFVVAVLAAALAASFSTSASAFDAEWVVQLKVTDLSNMNYGPMTTYGTGQVSYGHTLPDVPPIIVSMWCPHSGTDQPYWSKDVRTPEPPEVTMTWNLVIHASPQYASTKFRFHAWNPALAAKYDIDADPGFRVVLYKGSGVEYTFDASQNGTSSAPQWTKEYDITAGQTIDDFRLVREPIPEPASMAALIAGVLGLAASALRRRG